MNSRKWIVVGISGATCSGKTSLANRIHEELKGSVLIHQDDYFLPTNDPRHVRIPELNHNNWELLTSVDFPKLHSDIRKIFETIPEETAKGGKVMILDGFLLFKYKPISDLCDMKYFLTLTKEQCWERRKNRTYDPPDVPGYFAQIVWPEYENHERELRSDQEMCKTITFVDGSRSKKDIFELVFAEIKKSVS